MSTVYLYFSAKDILQSSFLLQQHAASSFLYVFEAVLESTLWNAAELLYDGYLNGLNVTTPMAS